MNSISTTVPRFGGFSRADQAPIIELSETTALQAVRNLQASIVNYAECEADVGRWAEKVNGAMHILKQAESDLLTQPGMRCFCYMLDGKPVGVLVVDMGITEGSDSLYMHMCATHPGCDGAGMALLEKAVNISESIGKEGRVIAMANPVSGALLAAAGAEDHFSLLDLSNIKLQPRENPGLWTSSGGRWQLKSSAGGQYLG